MPIKNINNLNSQADNLLPDNNQQLISPADVRNTIKDLNDSALNRIDDKIYLSLRAYSPLRNYEPQEGCFFGGIIYECINTTSGPFNPADWEARSSPNGTWGSILGDINNQADLLVLLSGKQDSVSANSPIFLNGSIINIQKASAVASGYLDVSDWNLFNAKENFLTFESPMIRNANTISIPYVSESQDGILSASDWSALKGEFIEVSYNDALLLAQESRFESGRYYKILGATRPTQGPGTFGDVIVQAISTAQLGQVGYLISRVPIYELVGPSNLIVDLYSNSLTPAAGEVYLYNGRAYSNLTGTNAGIPLNDLSNWEPVPINNDLYYRSEIFIIHYDFITDWIFYKEDRSGNKISFAQNGQSVNAIDLFQWGNPNHKNNIAEDSFIENINDGRIYRNLKLQSAYLIPTNQWLFQSGTVYVEDSVQLPGAGAISLLGYRNFAHGAFGGVGVTGYNNFIKGNIGYGSIGGSNNHLTGEYTALSLQGNFNRLQGSPVSISLDASSHHNNFEGLINSATFIGSQHNRFLGNHNSLNINNSNHSFFVGRVSGLILGGDANYNAGIGSFSGIDINAGDGNFIIHNINNLTINNGSYNFLSGSINGMQVNGNNNFVGGSGSGLTLTSGSNFNVVYGNLNGVQISNSQMNTQMGGSFGVNLTNAYYNSLSGFVTGITLSNSSGNSLLGYHQGLNLNNVSYHSLFGQSSGLNITNASYNSFFGYNSGITFLNSSMNSLLGSHSGINCSNSNYNTLAGRFGGSLSSAGYNSFFGNIQLAVLNSAFNVAAGLVNGSLTGQYNTLLGNLNSFTATGDSNFIQGSISGSVSGNGNLLSGVVSSASINGAFNTVLGAGGVVNISGNNNFAGKGAQVINGNNNFSIGEITSGLNGNDNFFFGRNAQPVNGSQNILFLNKSSISDLLIPATSQGNIIVGPINSLNSAPAVLNGSNNVVLGASSIDQINSNANLILGETGMLTIGSSLDHIAVLNVQTPFTPERSNVLYVPNNLVAVTDNSKLATFKATSLSENRTYTFQDSDGTVAFLQDIAALTNNFLSTSGGTVSGSILLADTHGVDAAPGASILTIGAANATTINIGNGSSVVNIQGTLNYQNVTNLEVTDKLIRLNKNGAINSASDSGFELEENAVVTGYVKSNSSRNAWLLKAPASNELTIGLEQLSSDRAIAFPDISGTVLLSEGNQQIQGIKTFLNGLTTQQVNVSGVSGNGFIELGAQTVQPALPPASSLRLFSNAGNSLSWLVNNGADTFSRSFIGNVTANRNYTLFDQDDALVGASVVQTLSNKTLASPKITLGSDSTGDMYYRDSAGNLSRINLGANGTVLSVNAGIPQWNAPAWLSLSGGTIQGNVGNTATGFFRIPNGTTAQRPGSPSNGMLRYNTSLSKLEVYENGTWVSYLTAVGNYLPTSGGTLTGDLDNTATGFLKIPSGTAAQRPATPGNGMLRYNTSINAIEAFQNGAWTTLSGSSSAAAIRRTYNFSLIGTANSTTGLFAKAAVASGNPSGMLPTTTGSSPGLNNGANDPYLILNAATIVSLRLTFYSAAVAQGTVGATPTLRLAIYKIGATSRTLLGNLDFSVNPANCGIWNDVSVNRFQTSALSGLSLSVNAGDLIGVEFVNQGGNNNQINAISQMQVILETTE
jgi:hypothetical protein